MARVHGAVGDDAAQRRVGENLSELTTTLRAWLNTHPPAATPAADTVQHLLDLADAAALRRCVMSTSDNDLDIVTDAFQQRLAAVGGHSDWADVFDQFDCTDAVVLLTRPPQQGPGLPHCVLPGPPTTSNGGPTTEIPGEATSTFFVGLSRAAQRLIFTTTTRHARSGRIAAFFTMLDDAGVPEIDHG